MQSRAARWQILKKSDSPQFFILQHGEYLPEGEPVNQILSFAAQQIDPNMQA
jgi:hypothetical protein